ncbi:MAG: sensor histidine kinase [Thiobacillus sp.]|nr:sensor histidine kinase [Thiobacillus sp.]
MSGQDAGRPPPHQEAGGTAALRPARPKAAMEEEDILSLRHHLVNWLFTPLYLLLLFSAVIGYIAALKLSNQPYDLLLTERARLIASRFDLSPEQVVPEAAELLPDGAEHLSFTLFDADHKPLLGNATLPRPRPRDFAQKGPWLRNTSVSGEKVRLLTLHFQTTRRTPGNNYVLVMAEPIKDRLVLGRSILANIVIPQFIFILIAGFAVWIGLNHGFEPLERLRRQVASRRRDDLSPLDESQAPGEIRPFIREINHLMERLKAAMDSQRQFVANAAHQLRTPFAGLVSQAELAKREQAPPTVREALEGICLGAKRCARLVNQLLALARNAPDVGLEERIERLDLARLARDSAARWVPEALAKGVDLGYEGSPTGVTVRGQESALADLVDNLVDNAVRYTPPGGHVTVSVGSEGNEPWLRVEDDGPGVPREMRDKIFQRFFRISGSTQPGSGLGLAIVREAAGHLGARVEVAEGVGGYGTSFLVRFPPALECGLPDPGTVERQQAR